jgi:hypothetical protein
MTSDAADATKVLSHLIEGEEVAGLRFGGPQLLFTSGAGRPLGEPYINLLSAWAIYGTRPASFPAREEDVPGERDSASECAVIMGLRNATVQRVEVLEPVPHLVLTFTDGRVLFLWGGHPQYESWQAGLSFSGKESWLVVAAPGRGVAVWAPASFWAGAA